MISFKWWQQRNTRSTIVVDDAGNHVQSSASASVSVSPLPAVNLGFPAQKMVPCEDEGW